MQLTDGVEGIVSALKHCRILQRNLGGWREGIPEVLRTLQLHRCKPHLDVPGFEHGEPANQGLDRQRPSDGGVEACQGILVQKGEGAMHAGLW